MTLKEQMQADLLFVEDDMENKTFTWNGEDYTCIPGALSEVYTLGVGGFGQNLTKVLVVRKDQFTDCVYPLSKEKLTYDDKTYRIVVVVENANKAFMRLLLSDDNEGI